MVQSKNTFQKLQNNSTGRRFPTWRFPTQRPERNRKQDTRSCDDLECCLSFASFSVIILTPYSHTGVRTNTSHFGPIPTAFVGPAHRSKAPRGRVWVLSRDPQPGLTWPGSRRPPRALAVAVSEGGLSSTDERVRGHVTDTVSSVSLHAIECVWSQGGTGHRPSDRVWMCLRRAPLWLPCHAHASCATQTRSPRKW